MKKIFGMLVIFAMFVSGISVTYAAGVENTKIIYRITDENEFMNVSVVLRGESEKIMGMTFYIGYDEKQVEPVIDSFKLNENFKDWLVPNLAFSTMETKNGHCVRFWLSAVDKTNLYIDLDKNAEIKIADFKLKKINITNENVISTDVSYNLRGKPLVSSVQSLPGKQLFTLGNNIMPDSFSIEYFPGTTGINIEKIEITTEDDCSVIAVGKTKQLNANILPTAMASEKITWTADSCVSISDTGLVTANAVGNATVTATAKDKKATFEITVVENEILPQSIEIIGESNCATGGIYNYSVKVLPDNATNKNVKWSVDGIINADINPKSGTLIANSVGKVNITAVSISNPAVSAVLPITISKAVPDNYTIDSASLMINDILYANSLSWSDASKYKLSLKGFNVRGAKLPDSWESYYTIEYSDNFNGLKGIKRDGNTIIVSKDAQDAENLEITANVISKIDGTTVCTATTQPFKVVSALNVTDVKFDGADATENADGTYSLKLTADALTFNVSANRTPYISYSLNGGKIKRGDVNIAKTDLQDGKNKLVIYIHGDSRYSAAGYKLNSLAKTVIAEIER